MNGRSYLTVGLLFAINLLNYMDRFTIASVLTNIETFYSLNHSEGGLLQTSFIVSYMIMAPVFGYLGDRYSRKYIIIFGVLFWSLTTFLGSLIPKNYGLTFFFMRALVGTGEASYSTIAPTIIADLFKKDLRSKMLALFYFAIPVGSGLGYIVGSKVATALNDWVWALRVTPPLGVISAILVFIFLREPQRGQSDGADQVHEETKLVDDLKYLMTVRSYIWSTIGFTCVCFAIGALSWWAPTYMEYAYKVSGDEVSNDWVSLIFGVIACVGGIVGVIAGSSASQYFRRFNNRSDPLVCAFGVLAGVPCVFIGLVVPQLSFTFSWIFIFIGITFLSMNWSIIADILLYVITPHRRSMAQAIQILVSHLFGDASSPFIVGLIADSLKSDTNQDKYKSLQYSLYITPFVLIMGGIAFLYNSLFITADQELCKAQTHGQRKRNSSETSIHTLPPNTNRSHSIIEGMDDINSHNTLIDSDNTDLISHRFN